MVYDLRIDPADEARVRIGYTHLLQPQPDGIARMLTRLTQILETEALNGARIPDWSTFRLSIEADEVFPDLLNLHSSVEAG